MKKILQEKQNLTESRFRLNTNPVVKKSPGIVNKARQKLPSPGTNNTFADTSEFINLKDLSGLTDKSLAGFLGLTDRTIRTKKDKGQTFDISQTERLRKLAHLFREGVQVFGTAIEFNRWLGKPSYGLDNNIPLELLKQPGGSDRITQELLAIKYGESI